MKFKKNRYIIFLLCSLWIILVIASCSANKSSVGTTYTVIIHINYEESTGLNYRDDAKLYVDDIEVGDVPYGSDHNYEVTLTEGTHTIYLKKDTSNG